MRKRKSAKLLFMLIMFLFPIASKKEELPMDCMSLTLLSTQRHHEHMLESIPELPEQVKRKKSNKKKDFMSTIFISK